MVQTDAIRDIMYTNWLLENGYPMGKDPNQFLFDEVQNLTKEQRDWLIEFVTSRETAH